MMTAERTGLAADMAWVEQLVAESTKLQETRPEYYTLDGHLWVKAEGDLREAHAWQVAVGGSIRPSHVHAGVRRQEVWGPRVCVEVIDDPKKRGADRG